MLLDEDTKVSVRSCALDQSEKDSEDCTSSTWSRETVTREKGVLQTVGVRITVVLQRRELSSACTTTRNGRFELLSAGVPINRPLPESKETPSGRGELVTKFV